MLSVPDWLERFFDRAGQLDPTNPMDVLDLAEGAENIHREFGHLTPEQAAEVTAPDWAIEPTERHPHGGVPMLRVDPMRQRDELLAVLAHTFPSGLLPGTDYLPHDWQQQVVIDLPTGQVAWHYHLSSAYLFLGLPKYAKPLEAFTSHGRQQRIASMCGPRY